MKQYKELVKDILKNGTPSDDRTGTGTLSVFGRQIRFNLQKGFPLVTLKKTYWKGVLVELLWLMGGYTNIEFLNKHGVKIWDEWADENGDLGPVYGQQWRNWKYPVEGDSWQKNADGYDEHLAPETWVESLDQLENVIHRIKNRPNCRRLIVSAWNAGAIQDMTLPPCHALFQFYVRNGKLSCHLYQRSADLFLGVPFNIASYALMTHLIANECDLEVGDFVHTFSDAHIYNNHIDQSKEMVSRTPLPLSKLKIDIPKGELLNFIDNKFSIMSWEDIQEKIKLSEYYPHPAIKGDVSV